MYIDSVYDKWYYRDWCVVGNNAEDIEKELDQTL